MVQFQSSTNFSLLSNSDEKRKLYLEELPEMSVIFLFVDDLLRGSVGVEQTLQVAQGQFEHFVLLVQILFLFASRFVGPGALSFGRGDFRRSGRENEA